ncbi:N-acetylglucosamine-6-phosphate deacetylase [Candidatus Bipolaricaulota bacterium]|nr:N-acetylglucosamine-6-phosphate deacetylase [Candidatus Bipolaricaulota bacterium]
MKKILKSGMVVFPEKGEIRDVDVVIKDGKIYEIGENITGLSTNQVMDLKGSFLSPGFIDLQVNGGGGVDFLTCESNELDRAGDFWLQGGTTSFLGTVITQDIESMNDAIGTLLESDLPNLLGVHVEGPFLSPEKRGTHNKNHLKKPAKKYFDRIIRGHEKGIELFTFAPDVEGAVDLLNWVKEIEAEPSIGHTNAGYDTALSFVEGGVSSFTHLFNGMRGFHHREPGTVGAALNSDAMVGLIADGLHLHPGAIQLVEKTKSPDEVCLITDAIAAAGMDDGEYVLGDQEIIVENGLAKLDNGTIAGSTLTLDNAVSNYLEFTDAELLEAIQAVTVNPADLLDRTGDIGTMKKGSLADFVVLDRELNVEYTIVNGEVVFESEDRSQR